MKYKDWLNQAKPDPIRGTPIKCPCCGYVVGYDKDFMFMVLTQPAVCPKCDEIVIMPTSTAITC